MAGRKGKSSSLARQGDTTVGTKRKNSKGDSATARVTQQAKEAHGGNRKEGKAWCDKEVLDSS